MTKTKHRIGRYQRVRAQLEPLLAKTDDAISRMATTAAVLHHKMPGFFWTGFYRLVAGQLVIGPYQGSLACPVLTPRQGVCWAAVERREAIIVPDVNAFPGHIACDSRSKSEIAVPVLGADGQVKAVLDVDSTSLAAFDDTDADHLTRIAAMIV
jgi:GAF domain-containing protein